MNSPEKSLAPVSTIRNAPTNLLGIAKELGPGLIIAGSVVGSGELIATTVAGAEAGFWLLWVILLGCTIKVFVQLEVGKYSILNHQTTLAGLSNLPGWKPRGLHWIGWMALLMFLGGIGQMGGIAGGVGQALTIAAPITAEGVNYNQASEARLQAKLATVLQASGPAALEPVAPEVSLPPAGRDVYYWTFLVAVFTAFVLFIGRYGFIEKVVLIMVVGFTAISLLNFAMLQQQAVWAVTWADFMQGLRFQLPPKVPGIYPLATALAAFGIIGMAAGEIIFYPYWCLEKGYAANVGPDDKTAEWTDRAKGWIRVMHWDAWCSMLVYTVSTVAFYLLGAAVLGRVGLHPQGMDMISTLSAMYKPVFGDWASGLFLVGAIAVLYSTFFVNSASSALVWSDAIFRLRGAEKSGTTRYTGHRQLAVALPLLSFGLFCVFPNPRAWVIFAGMTQTLMLPLLGYVAIKYRFRPEARRFGNNRLIDGLVMVAAFGLTLAGGWLLLTLLFPQVRELG